MTNGPLINLRIYSLQYSHTVRLPNAVVALDPLNDVSAGNLWFAGQCFPVVSRVRERPLRGFSWSPGRESDVQLQHDDAEILSGDWEHMLR